MTGKLTPLNQVFLNLWQRGWDHHKIASQLGQSPGAAYTMAWDLRRRGFITEPKKTHKETPVMSRANQVTREFMKKQGFFESNEVAKELSHSAGYVLALANRAGKGAVIGVGRFEFVNAEMVKKQRDKEVAARKKAAPAPKSKTDDSHPTQTATFWQELRKLVRDELVLVLKQYEAHGSPDGHNKESE